MRKIRRALQNNDTLDEGQDRIRVDDTDPHIFYSSGSPYLNLSASSNAPAPGPPRQWTFYNESQGMGSAWNGTAAVTTQSGTWLQFPFSGDSLTVGLLSSTFGFSADLKLDDGSSRTWIVPPQNGTDSSLKLNHFHVHNLSCGTHSALLTSKPVVNTNNVSILTPGVLYFDWYSYPKPGAGACQGTVTKTDSTLPTSTRGVSKPDSVQSSGKDGETIAGIAAGSVLGALFLALLLTWWYRKRRSSQTELSNENSPSELEKDQGFRMQDRSAFPQVHIEQKIRDPTYLAPELTEYQQLRRPTTAELHQAFTGYDPQSPPLTRFQHHSFVNPTVDDSSRTYSILPYMRYQPEEEAGEGPGTGFADGRSRPHESTAIAQTSVQGINHAADSTKPTAQDRNLDSSRIQGASNASIAAKGASTNHTTKSKRSARWSFFPAMLKLPADGSPSKRPLTGTSITSTELTLTPNFSLPTSTRVSKVAVGGVGVGRDGSLERLELRPEFDSPLNGTFGGHASADTTTGHFDANDPGPWLPPRLAYMRNKTRSHTATATSTTATNPHTHNGFKYDFPANALGLSFPKTPARPKTAPERVIKYHSGLSNHAIMFELVDGDELQRSGCGTGNGSVAADTLPSRGLFGSGDSSGLSSSGAVDQQRGGKPSPRRPRTTHMGQDRYAAGMSLSIDRPLSPTSVRSSVRTTMAAGANASPSHAKRTSEPDASIDTQWSEASAAAGGVDGHISIADSSVPHFRESSGATDASSKTTLKRFPSIRQDPTARLPVEPLRLSRSRRRQTCSMSSMRTSQILASASSVTIVSPPYRPPKSPKRPGTGPDPETAFQRFALESSGTPPDAHVSC